MKSSMTWENNVYKVKLKSLTCVVIRITTNKLKKLLFMRWVKVLMDWTKLLNLALIERQLASIWAIIFAQNAPHCTLHLRKFKVPHCAIGLPFPFRQSAEFRAWPAARVQVQCNKAPIAGWEIISRPNHQKYPGSCQGNGRFWECYSPPLRMRDAAEIILGLNELGSY